MNSKLIDHCSAIPKQYTHLRNKKQKIADFILQNPQQVISLPVQILAKQCCCEQTTTIRFAQQLGFSGYTDLSGYTQYTVKTPGPDLDLIKALCDKVNVPVIAEGKFMTPEDVDKGLAAGAHSVVIGKMITNVMFITSQFIAKSERIAK